MNQSGAAWAVTAAHCFLQRGIATSIVNRMQGSQAYTPLADIVSSSANSAGTYPDRHGDVAVYKYRANSSYPSSNGGWVYAGQGNPSTGRRVQGTRVLPRGYQSDYIRTSGSSGLFNGANNSLGEISPDWISLTNYDVYFTNSDATYTDLTVAEDVSECTVGGDSGGAFYQQSGSGALALGIISGTNNSGGGPTNCRNYYTPVNLFYFSQAIQVG